MRRVLHQDRPTDVPFDDRIVADMVDAQRARRLTDLVERLTPEATAITFAVPDDLADAYRFAPGQHLTLRRTVDGAEVRNSYSICQSAHGGRPGTLRVAAAKVPGGRMSPWLVDELAAGDVVYVMTPLGDFTCPVQPDAARHHVAIAAGSGITPILALVSTALEEEPGSRVTLLFGNRRTSTVMFLEELEDLKDRYGARLHLIHVLSREAPDVELFHGRIDKERLTRILDALVPVEGIDEVYLCGPFGMVQDAQALLSERGFGKEHVHHEIFHVDEDGAPKPAPVIVDTSAPPAAVVTVAQPALPAGGPDESEAIVPQLRPLLQPVALSSTVPLIPEQLADRLVRLHLLEQGNAQLILGEDALGDEDLA